MVQITLKIQGMMCVILADQAIPKSQLAPVIEKTGYQLTEVNCVPYEKKKGLLSRIFG